LLVEIVAHVRRSFPFDHHRRTAPRRCRGTTLGFVAAVITSKPTLSTADVLRAEAKERKTTDLCGNEYAGARCMRKHGHEGMHECLYWNNEQSVRWD